MKNNSRYCPLCNSLNQEVLYVQHFSRHFAHQIVSCRSCGFVFVGNIPGFNYYHLYYRKMSKYEDTRDLQLHSDSVKYIKTAVRKNGGIIDIGCSTGHLLYLLKKDGYQRLSGIDPAPRCREIAARDYGLKITTADLYKFTPGIQYDFVIMSAVLEHLPEVKLAIERVRSLLQSGGRVFISVPDAGNFYRDFDEPFGEFSIEHINFFDQTALTWLMRGFQPLLVKLESKAIYSVWEKRKSTSGVSRPPRKLKAAIMTYIVKSKKMLDNIQKTIDRAPDQIIVYGAGSLTQRLLASTKLSQKVKIFIDRDKNLIGKKLKGIPIVSPDNLVKYTGPVLVSSFRFKQEIIDLIKSRKLQNRIITF